MRSSLPVMIRALACFLVCAVAAPAMNNDDVVKMIKAQLSEDTIVVAVEAAKPADFNTEAEALIALKSHGVSDRIIQAMIKARQGGTAPKEEAPPAKRPPITFTAVPDAEMLPPAVEPVPGKEYFLRMCMRVEDDDWASTNYWQGVLIPINSKVVLKKIKGDSVFITVAATQMSIEVENKPEYTNRTAKQLAAAMLSEKPTPIEKYGEEMAAAIRTGNLRHGMTKTQVLLTRGYPPAHETPSLDNPLWKYWKWRFRTMTLEFDGNILVAGAEED